MTPPRPTPCHAAPWLPWFLVAYLGAGLAISLLLFPLGDVDVESDFFAELGPAAQALARGEVEVTNHPYKGPGQPGLLVLLHGLLGPLGVGWYRAAVVLSLLAAGAALVATWRVGLALGGRAVAAGAVLLLASSPTFAVQAHKASSDMVFLALVAWTLALVLGPAVNPRSAGSAGEAGNAGSAGACGRPGGQGIAGDPAWRWFAAGLLAGLALLTRYAGVVLPVWLVLVAWWRNGAGVAATRRRPVLAAVAGCLLPVAPWVALNLIQAGVPLATANAENVVREFGAGATIPGAAWHLLTNLPARLVASGEALFGRAGAAAAAIALALMIPRRRPWRHRALLLWLALALLVLATVFFRPRFALPLAPVGALAVAWLLLRRLERPRPAPGARAPGLRARGPAWVVLAVLALVGLPRIVDTVQFHAERQPRDLQGVIGHLASLREGPPGGPGGPRRGAGDAVVMARKAHAPFHAGVGWRPYPSRPLAAREFLQRARAVGATHVLAGSVERDHATVGFDLGRLGSLTGVETAYADPAQRLLRLDLAVPTDSLGRDPRLPALREVLAGARRADDPVRTLVAARAVAGALTAVGRRVEARDVLQEAVAHGATAVPAAQPELLRVRVDLAWVALLTDRPALGIDAVGPVLEVFAAQDDHALAARACEFLGLCLAERRRPDDAREVLHAAAVFWEAAGEPEAVARVRRLRRGI